MLDETFPLKFNLSQAIAYYPYIPRKFALNFLKEAYQKNRITLDRRVLLFIRDICFNDLKDRIHPLV